MARIEEYEAILILNIVSQVLPHRKGMIRMKKLSEAIAAGLYHPN
jgi:hypothetical protein